ncbi:MAG: EAL domain-containing protein, partial [Gammaproteobacteria bacterium]|nr:EAL domain-containing protein [Gammaproteobacteria bacterium]
FRHQAQPQAAGDAGDRLADGDVRVVARHAFHEQLAELEALNGQSPQVVERTVAFAEIVDGQQDAHLPQFGEGVDGVRGVLDEGALGELQLQRAARERKFLEHVTNGGRKVIAQELTIGHVDRHPDQPQAFVAPRGHLLAGLAEHPAADPHDVAGGLGMADEVVRTHFPELAVAPADERLGGDDRAAAHVHLRLVHEMELARIHRAPQLGFQAQAVLARFLQRGRVDLPAVAGTALALVHRRVGVLDQGLRAVDNGEFHLVYQPQVDMRRGTIVAAEALIRWRNRQLGEMRPDHFIGHAETTGDIVRIGRWVLSEACKQVAAWREDGLGIVRVAVNVSYRQFLGDDLAATVRDVLDEFSLPGSALELEFTERALIEDSADAIHALAELREMGILLTIDDFGEGYSALNYLRRLPIQGLKLSHLFVEGVPRNHSDVAVCQAIAGIARSLGLGLVAEGVESEAQRQFLLELGVNVGQGFLFAPGLTPAEFERRMSEAREATATG